MMLRDDIVLLTAKTTGWTRARVFRESYHAQWQDQDTPEAAEAERARELWDRDGTILPTVRAFCEERLKAMSGIRAL